jgi:DNA-binding LacI/PurR family transcriptional regulator
MLNRKLFDFEVTKVAAQALCKRETVRKYFTSPDRMLPSTRARIESALQALGYIGAGDKSEAEEPARQTRS